MEGFFFLLEVIFFGALFGLAIIFLVTAAMEFLDGSIIKGIIALCLAVIMCILGVAVFKELHNPADDWHEIEVKQVQIDTTYTTTKNKVDTTYVVRYIK